MGDFRPEKNYILGIDGLRAISIIAVLFFHCNLFYIDNHYSVFDKIFQTLDIGVDIFFVISGFLITGILLRTVNGKNYYRNFMFRRILRIFPVYYLLLFFSFVILPQFDHPKIEEWSSVTAWPYWLYLSNFAIAAQGRFLHGIVDISWSLAIEEQFYLIWPWVILWFKPKILVKICIGGTLASFLLRFICYGLGFTLHDIHLFTFTHLDGLLFGSLISLSLAGHCELTSFKKKAYPISIISFVSILILTLIPHNSIVYLFAFCRPLIVALGAGAVIYLITQGRFTFLNHKVLVNIGKYSYGIYLFHNPIQAALQKVFIKDFFNSQGALGSAFVQFGFVGIVLIISYMAAYVSFHLFEKHFLKLKRFFSYQVQKSD